MVRLYNLTRGRWLAHRLEVRHRMLGRMRGLLGCSHLEEGEGLWLLPANAIHTWAMRFSIDVLFLDESFSVLRALPSLPPWRWAMERRAFSVIELPAGILRATGTQAGDGLAVVAERWEEGALAWTEPCG